MSMMGHFRVIKPELLKRLQQDPSLTEAVVYADVVGGEASSEVDVNTMLKGLPTKQRELMKAALSSDIDAVMKLLPEKQRQSMKALFSSLTPEQRSRRVDEFLQATAPIMDALKGLAADVRRRTGGQVAAVAADLGERVNLDKAWHGLHYLLCGRADRVQEPLGLAILGGTEIGGDRGYGPARYLEVSQVDTVASALSDLTKETLKRRYNPVAMNMARVYPGHWDNPHNADNLDWLLDAFDDLLAFYQRVAVRGNAVILYLS